MPQRPADLPDFENPPVREVAIAGHFEPLVALRQAHIGYFWSKIRTQFPEVEDREPLVPYVESLDEAARRPSFQLEMLSSPMPNRAWFVSSDQSELLQLQRDRFVHNWRYQNDRYPHFEPLLGSFTEGFETLGTALRELGLPQPRLNHAEVTYVNRIHAPALNDFLVFVSGPELGAGGVVSDGAFGQIGLRFLVLNEGKMVGRLYLECSPGLSEGGEVQDFQMTLTFRAPVQESNFDKLRTLLLQGREAIVHTFAALTHPKYHEQWSRIR